MFWIGALTVILIELFFLGLSIHTDKRKWTYEDGKWREL